MASRCCEESRLIQKLAKSLELFARESEFNNLNNNLLIRQKLIMNLKNQYNVENIARSTPEALR